MNQIRRIVLMTVELPGLHVYIFIVAKLQICQFPPGHICSAGPKVSKKVLKKGLKKVTELKKKY